VKAAPAKTGPVKAVVFAYHDVGARCLRVLRAQGLEVPLVVTHRDDPGENVWFACVADVAADLGLRAITPDDPNTSDLRETVAALSPDFLFSFYYRRMLGPGLLDVAPRGALNMHGSLLPQYRGRAPVNWAILRGERYTGATLHYMTAEPDAGDIVGQQAVPILPDDTAREVQGKVTLAAEIVLDGALPALLRGDAPRRPNRIAEGSYFGRRRPEDGRIDWQEPARRIHDLVRAVAPPYPGAFTTLMGRPARLLATRVREEASPPAAPALFVRDGAIEARCGGGGTLHVRALEVDGHSCDAAAFVTRFGRGPVPPA
jgi:methionyl-tRNA formyltransferase